MRPRRRAEAPGYPREARLRGRERIMYSKTIKVRIYSCDFTAQTHRGDPAGKEFSTRSAPQIMHFTELYNHQGALRRRCATVCGMRCWGLRSVSSGWRSRSGCGDPNVQIRRSRRFERNVGVERRAELFICALGARASRPLQTGDCQNCRRCLPALGGNRQRVMYALGARASCPLQTGDCRNCRRRLPALW